MGYRKMRTQDTRKHRVDRAYLNENEQSRHDGEILLITMQPSTFADDLLRFRKFVSSRNVLLHAGIWRWSGPFPRRIMNTVTQGQCLLLQIA